MTKLAFLAGNNYPDSSHLQGGMKFATQISPLLYYILNFSSREYGETIN